jgi:HlyD family secretion protein
MASKLSWLVVLLLVAAGIYYFGPFRGGDEAPKVSFETKPIERGSVVAKVTASGTLSALVTVQVGSQVSGRIKDLMVDFNSQVKKGQVIARIDPQLFSATLEQSRASHVAAQADLEKARVQAAEATRQYERTKALAAQKLVAEADLDSALANAEAAKAQVSATAGRLALAQAALNQARVNLGYTTITSPIDGIVISRSVDVGQTVAASLQAPTLFVIAEDLRKMQVNTSVAEADIGKLRDGMPATFTVDAYPQQKFEGRVRQIRNAAQNVQNVITYDAVIDVDNPELKLKPGMTANVTFVHAEKSDVLVVPNAAMRFRPTPEMLGEPAGGTAGAGGPVSAPPAAGTRGPRGAPITNVRTVWVLRGGKPSAVEITVGLTDGSRTELVEGALQAGDALVVDAAVNGMKGTTPGAQMPMRRIL